MYKLTNSDFIIFTDADGTIWWIPNDPANRHWQQYQAWLAADPNNQPLPADGE
jgi:hypothetical protein